MSTDTCPWCGMQTRSCAGPTHRYLESSPGCWALYGELLAREYNNVQYMRVHNLSVDAYALQHPGKESPQTISSAHVHLASLHGYFSANASLQDLARIKQTVVQHKSTFKWLMPPADLTGITVKDVLAAGSAAEHEALVVRWARYVYRQWGDHHARVNELIVQAGH